MTTTAPYRPRHAAVEAPVTIETATMAVPAVPSPRRAPVSVAPPPAAFAATPVRPPQVLPGWAPLPPAGLPVGHPPVPRRRMSVAGVAVLVGTLVLAGVAAGVGTAVRASSADDQTSSTTSASLQEQIAQWRDGGGMTRLQAIEDDLADAGTAGRSYDVAGLGSACSALQRDVESAQAYAPIPDARAQASWSSALAHGARSATYCIGGTDQLSAPMIDRASTEMSDMGADLRNAADRIGAINGR